MKKQTILEGVECVEISTFLKMLLVRVEKDEKPDCNIDLVKRYIKDLDR